MRRGELFRLEWQDLDFKRGSIYIRTPKGGRDQKIPLNQAARELLEAHPRTGSPYVFPGRRGNQRTDVNKQVTRIKEAPACPRNPGRCMACAMSTCFYIGVINDTNTLNGFIRKFISHNIGKHYIVIYNLIFYCWPL